MANIFAGSEVVEIGIQIEKNGRDFYNTLAGKTRKPKAAELFIFLAQEEEKHILAFQGILNKAEHLEPQGLDADQYYAYMNALASGYIFTQKDKGAEIAKTIKADIDAVDAGIGFEKESIVFYEGIKQVVPPHDHKIIDELIVQEESHLRKLLDLKKAL
ncbi:MAG: ferritin family protein [Candidatus Omnitrophota bacterium]